MILSRSYNGASVRRQAHAFADDIVLATTGKPGIAQLHGTNGQDRVQVADGVRQRRDLYRGL